jgi:hypothetical protein
MYGVLISCVDRYEFAHDPKLIYSIQIHNPV